jgi:hypothetical protein
MEFPCDWLNLMLVQQVMTSTLVSLKSEHDVDTLKENKLIKFVYEPSNKLSLLFITKM